MIAPALAPATFTHFLIGFVGWSAKPSSAPASPSPLTPPPRNTPSASSIQSIETATNLLPARRRSQPESTLRKAHGAQAGPAQNSIAFGVASGDTGSR